MDKEAMKPLQRRKVKNRKMRAKDALRSILYDREVNIRLDEKYPLPTCWSDTLEHTLEAMKTKEEESKVVESAKEKNMTDEEIKAIQNLREINGWLRLKSDELWNAGDTRQSKKCLQMVDKANYVMNVIAGKPLLTDDERMYIENIIQPFRSIVFGIRKTKDDGMNSLVFLSEYDISLYGSAPYIPIGDMEFSGLELDKDYCFEELGIYAE